MLTQIRLTLAVGSYAQATLLGKRRAGTMTETVAAWPGYGPGLFPLPHPSWRTTAWENRNPWFAAELLPALRTRVHALLNSP